MNPTKLLYFDAMHRYHETAKVLEIATWDDGRMDIILDGTILYPQGGGQPYDTGKLTSTDAEFTVQEVRFNDGIVHHIGWFVQGSFSSGDQVMIIVDKARRDLHSRFHTAGHLVDCAFERLGIAMTPGRAYHFPDGPYVEYEGLIEGDKDEFVKKIEAEMNKIIEEKKAVSVKLADHQELAKLCKYVPDYIPKDKPSRVMIVESCAGIPCGGTHVSNTSEIGKVALKIKCKKGNTRVSYQLV